MKKGTERLKTQSSLTEEEILQLRKMLAGAKRTEQQTATSSKASFLEWVQTVPALCLIVDKAKSVPWEQIYNCIKDIFI